MCGGFLLTRMRMSCALIWITDSFERFDLWLISLCVILMNSRTLSMCSLPSLPLLLSSWLTSTAATSPLQRRPRGWGWSTLSPTLAWTNKRPRLVNLFVLSMEKHYKRQHECKRSQRTESISASFHLWYVWGRCRRGRDVFVWRTLRSRHSLIYVVIGLALALTRC